MTQCPEKERDLKNCNCSYPGCGKKGKCCDCLRYHLGMRQLPACAFPNDVERSYDRSFANFARLVNEGKV